MVASSLESKRDRRTGLTVIGVGPDGGLDGWRVEVELEVLRWERIGKQFSDVVSVAVGEVVEHGLDLAGAEVVRDFADIDSAVLVAILDAVVAVAWAVHGVV